MALETARLAGLLPLLEPQHRDRADHVIEVLTPPFAESLVSEIIRRRGSVLDSERVAIEQAYPIVPERIRRSLIEVELLGGTLSGKRSGVNQAVTHSWHDGTLTAQDMVFDGYDMLLPELDTITSLAPEPGEQRPETVRPALHFVVKDGLFTSESDAIEVDHRWYFDSLSYPHSDALDLSEDPLVLAMADGRVALNPRGEVANLRSALWLGYPMTGSWGHFVLECLTRMAMFDELKPPGPTTVVVSGAVPRAFIDFAEFVYPWARFLSLGPGTHVRIDECSVIPSRVLTLGRFRWSADANARPNMESESLTVIARHLAESLDRHGARRAIFPSRVFLDRSAALYRRSESEPEVRALAERHRFVSIDPGTLAPAEEINLFVNAEEVCGYMGSQTLLGVAIQPPARQLYVYHDEAREMRGMSHALSLATGTVPQWLLGERPYYLPGYSEESIHQPILLNEEALSAAENWLSS